MEHVSIFFIPNFKAGGRPFKDKSSTNEDLCFLSLSLIETSFASLKVDTFFFYHPNPPNLGAEHTVRSPFTPKQNRNSLNIHLNINIHLACPLRSAFSICVNDTNHKDVFNKQRPQQVSPHDASLSIYRPSLTFSQQLSDRWTHLDWWLMSISRRAQICTRDFFFLLLHGSASLQGSQMDKCVKFKNILSEVKIKSCEFVFGRLDLPLTL